MPLTIHHLHVSQSERILWLCEELSVPYQLKLYTRAPLLSPPSYLALHPIGAAPVITDPEAEAGHGLTLAETGAIVEYILNIYASPSAREAITIAPGGEGYGEYVYWLHYANGTLQPAIGRWNTLRWAGVHEDNNVLARTGNKVNQTLSHLDSRLRQTGAWVAGEKFTAADVMLVFSLTTMRVFAPVDLSKYEAILEYLERVAKREAYVRAMEKGDAGMDWTANMKAQAPEPFAGLKPRSQQQQQRVNL